MIIKPDFGSMLGDWPESGGRVNEFYSDVDEDIFITEKEFLGDFSPVRTLNQIVVALRLEKDVKTYIVAPPLICKLSVYIKIIFRLNAYDELVSRGTGLFSEGTGQVHMLTQLALKKKQSVMVGFGSGVRYYMFLRKFAANRM